LSAGYNPLIPHLRKGTLRDRHGTSVRVAMGRCGVRWSLPDETSTTDGEVVWSWRRDRGVKLAGGILPTTVATNAAHRGEHV